MAKDSARIDAEVLVDTAWETADPARRAKFARKALALDPAAIDAYVILASGAETDAERVALLREGVARGDVLWKQHLKRPPDGFFWAQIETRSYLRAMHNLALALWNIGDREDAAKAADRILGLNANDNQGIRYLALAWHPVLGNWARVEALLDRYQEDEGAECLFAKCLNCIRTGSGAEAALIAAMEANPHVPKFLLAPRPRKSETTGGFVEVGSPTEAASYAAFNREAWASVPHALDWLRAAAKALNSKARRARS